MADLWKCEICGYVHTGGQAPDVCPICGAEKDAFTALKLMKDQHSGDKIASWRCTICGYIHHGAEAPESCPLCSAERNLFEGQLTTAGIKREDTELEKLVIVGAGVAGMTAAEQARVAAPDLPITMVSKEPGPPYYRLNLTRYLAGEVSEQDLIMQNQEWFQTNRIDLIEGEAKSIDRKNRRLHLTDNQILEYDRLILANGAHPFIPPIPGVTLEGVIALRSLANARHLLERCAQGETVVCVGGGLLGLETVGALVKRGAKAIVLEGLPWLLPRQLTQRAGNLLRDYVESTGITVHTNVRIKEILGDETVRGIRLESGEELPADVVVIAAGVRPNSSLARLSDLRVRNGVVVDDQMFTSDPNILACGDVAEHMGVLYGIWPASFAQGNTAGINAVGGNAAFTGLPPSSRLKVLDVNLFSLGQFQPTDASYDIFEKQDKNVYYRIVSRDGKIVGANLFGDTAIAMLLMDAVEQNRQIPELTELLDKIPEFADHWGLLGEKL